MGSHGGSIVRVVALGDERSRGFIVAGGLTAPCALGRSGVRAAKREGDGATPAGAFRLVAALYRSDRGARPATRLPLSEIRPDSGWCDDPADRNYNRPVRLPYAASHERLWREDRLYDVVVILDHNLDPVRKGAGSAIFLHIAGQGFTPTEGCVAVSPETMRRLLVRCDASTVIDIR